MLSNKIVTDKQCFLCKAVSSAIFAGAGIFHGVRMASLWRFYPFIEKSFNLAALTFLFGVSAANANAGYQIYMGQNMMLVQQSRPSILSRLTGNVEMSPEERYAYLDQLIRMEEEKEQV